MAVSFKELNGSPKETVTKECVQTTRQFKVAWSNRKQFIREKLGTADPDYPEAICSSCTVKNLPAMMGSSGDYAAYAYAIMECTYSSSEHPTVSESFEPSGEFLTVDSADYTWGSGGDAITQFPTGKLITTCDYVMSWKNLSYVPSGALALYGCVNSGALNPYTVNPILANITFGAQTLLFQPPIIDRVWNFILDAAAYNITYRFTYRPNWEGGVEKGWNWVWNAKTGTYQRVWSVSGAAYINIYPVAGFINLW